MVEKQLRQIISLSNLGFTYWLTDVHQTVYITAYMNILESHDSKHPAASLVLTSITTDQ